MNKSNVTSRLTTVGCYVPLTGEYRRFWAAYWDDRMSRNVGNYNQRCVTSQKSEYLIYIAQATWSHVQYYTVCCSAQCCHVAFSALPPNTRHLRCSQRSGACDTMCQCLPTKRLSPEGPIFKARFHKLIARQYYAVHFRWWHSRDCVQMYRKYVTATRT